MKKFLVFLLLFPVLALADAVIFSGTDVKALKQNLDLFGVVKVMSGNVDPSAGAGVAAPIGSAYLSTTSGLFLKTGVTNTGWTKNALLPVDLTSEVTGVLPVTSGGTGIADVPTNGEIPIGNGTNYTITTLTGTANQVSVTNGAGSITLATPQDIGTGSTVTFNNVTLGDIKYDGINTGFELAMNMSTGVLSGGFLSIDAIPSRFDMDAIQGQIVDSTANGDPERVNVACSSFDSVAVDNLATQDVTYILIDASCTITQQATFPNAAERRSKIFVGRLNHSNRTSILFANTIAEYLQSPMSQVYDLMNSLGAFNIGDGNKISANGANLSMNKSAGEMFVASYNYATNNQSPSNVTNIARTAFQFRYATQTTLSGSNVSVIDPTNYDNAGTITAVGGGPNTASVQRVYLFPSNNMTVQYGQATYPNLAAAIQGISSESFVVTPTSKGLAIPIAYIAIQKNCTSLLDTSCSKIIATNIFGASAGVSGGTTNLQQAYNNSSQPQVTTDATRGSMEFKRGSAADTDDVVRVLNGSGTKTASITGAGVITGSNLSGTNTGDTEIGNDAGNIGVAKEFDFPNSQIVQTDSTNKKFRIESGNNNELYNGGFEAETLAVGWTVSNATSSSSTTRIEGSKSLSLALTGALSLSQSSTINAAQKSGVQMVASIWVNSSDVSDLQLCSLKNGSEDKCTVTGGYVQGSGWRQLTVSFLGDATSNGLKLKSTDTTGTVLVDQAYVGIGSPIVDFTPDMVYSAKISSTGVVSDENTDFIQGDCTLSGTANNRKTCTFKTSVFTVSPNCVVVANSPACEGGGCGEYQTPVSVSASQIILAGLKNSDVAYSASSLQLICQKSGADYKTSKAYVASSSDYGWTKFTPTISGFGSPTLVDACLKRRSGENLSVRCSFTTGTTAASLASFTLPDSLSINTAKINATNTTSAAGQKVGEYFANQASNNGAVVTATGTSSNLLYFASNNNVANALIPANGNAVVTSATPITINFSIPIQGWTDSGVIVGSFQGYNETPGTSRVETFSVVFGTTNKDTPCTASPCSYISQIGNAVTNITRSGTGLYNLNLSKTYSKANCTIDARCASVSGGTVACIRPGSILSCENCNSVQFAGANGGITVNEDIAGTIICQGIPQ